VYLRSWNKQYASHSSAIHTQNKSERIKGRTRNYKAVIK